MGFAVQDVRMGGEGALDGGDLSLRGLLVFCNVVSCWTILVMGSVVVLTVDFTETCSEVVALLEDSFAAALDVGVEFGAKFAHPPAEVVEVEVDGRELGEGAVAVGECGCCILMLMGL